MRRKTAAECGAEGGHARAKNLTAEALTTIGKQGAAARWSPDGIPVAVYGDPTTPLQLGSFGLECYVLADGRRLLSQSALQGGIGLGRRAGQVGRARVTKFLSSLRVNPVLTGQIVARINDPVRFQQPDGTLDTGYDLALLPTIWRLVGEADRAGHVNVRQRHVAEQCRTLLDRTTDIGLVALADRTTGNPTPTTHAA